MEAKAKARSSSRNRPRRNTSRPRRPEKSLADRKVLDLRRWMCMSRPQLKKSCGISSVVSCWNYLYSRLGAGELDPLTQESALQIVGISPPFDNVQFGTFTGNGTLKKWFRKLCSHFKVKGSARTFYKGARPGKTSLATDRALELLLAGLRGSSQTFIYHCYNHYFCPIGFEQTPLEAGEAYAAVPTSCETWVAIGETSSGQPCIHFKRWSDIVLDINSGFPQFYDIRRQEKGVQTKEQPAYVSGAKAGTNLHCLIMLEKD